MGLAVIALAALLGWASDDGPAEPVARLGSARFTEREAAAESLKRLGRQALPALRKARSASDLEVRLRASQVRDEIEAAILLEPTMVRLDFHDRPLSEVVEAIGRRAGGPLALGYDPSIDPNRRDRPTGPDRRITLEAPDALPFWEAIDRLCRAGGLRWSYPQHPLGLDRLFDGLILAPGVAAPPRTEAGPFRVELLRVCRERDLALAPGLEQPDRGLSRATGPRFRSAPPARGPGVREVRDSSFFAELLISVEPRLRIVSQAPLDRLKATDDRGRSILREPKAEELQAEVAFFRSNPQLDPRLRPELRFGSGGQSTTTQICQIPLDDSAPPAGRLAELKGVIAVAVMGRRANPLVVPLADAGERTLEEDGVRVTIHEVQMRTNQTHGELELTLETERSGETLKVQGPGIGPLEIRRPFDLNQRQIEIRDDRDRPFDWSFLRAPDQGTRGRMRLLVRPRDDGERLDFSRLRLHIFTIVGAAAEIPFSFADVPMP
jgi:hypothetical protein